MADSECPHVVMVVGRGGRPWGAPVAEIRVLTNYLVKVFIADSECPHVVMVVGRGGRPWGAAVREI